MKTKYPPFFIRISDGEIFKRNTRSLYSHKGSKMAIPYEYSCSHFIDSKFFRLPTKEEIKTKRIKDKPEFTEKL